MMIVVAVMVVVLVIEKTEAVEIYVTVDINPLTANGMICCQDRVGH